MIGVLVVDDDFRVAAVHAEFVSATKGFTVVGVAHSAAQARARVAETRPDLVLLDVYLPDGSGIDLLRDINVDTFILTAADDTATVTAALRAGARQYLIKPFTGDQLSQRLRAYRDYLDRLRDAKLTQDELDRAQRSLVGSDSRPQRTVSATERLITDALRDSAEPLSAVEVARRLGIARATAQRYLGQLADAGTAKMTLRYGTTGRPEHEYCWAPSKS
jgi:two-component system CitB family response regulator